MATEIDAFIGRDNKRSWTIRLGGAVVPDNTITRVVLNLGGNCLDTNEPADPISLENNNTEVHVQLGLWAHATPGVVQGHQVVFDAQAPNGLAWPENEIFEVTFYDWGACTP